MAIFFLTGEEKIAKKFYRSVAEKKKVSIFAVY
jgi:hypothetical protein